MSGKANRMRTVRLTSETQYVRLNKRRAWKAIVKVDFDTPRVPRDFVERLRFLYYNCIPAGAEWTEAAPQFRLRRHRSTHGGWHVIVESDKLRLGPRETVAIQAILGSHWRREAFNLSRVVLLHRAPPMWRERWNVLYRRKYA